MAGHTGRFVTRLLDTDEVLGIERWFHHDVEQDTFTIETRQDVSALLELNKAEYNATERRTPFGKGGGGALDLHRVARVPLAILEQLRATGQHPEQDKQAFNRWLDGDGAIWKTRPKSLSV